jgi:4-alpha-glucanotransferase
MKIHFLLRYRTQPGESFSINLPDGRQLPMEYLNDEFWQGSAETDLQEHTLTGYSYILHDREGNKKWEANPGRLLSTGSVKPDSLTVFDYFNPAGLVENTFATQPFANIFFREKGDARQKMPVQYTHIFRVKAPVLSADEVPCILGHSHALRNWDTAAPILMQYATAPAGGQGGNGWWEARLDLSNENFPLGYKYGIWNTRTNRFVGFEDGANRAIYASHIETPPRPAAKREGDTASSPTPSPLGPGRGGVSTIIHHDNYARFPYTPWRGAGVAIPVFSLRSKNSFGVGEFTDLPLLADWATSVGLKVVQLLPINDTSATGTWMDSYPYSAISAFALHPMYLNLAEVAGKVQAALLKPLAKKQKELNALDAVDYEAVIHDKWTVIRQLYAAQKADFLTNPEFIRYFTENRHWLIPYAAFCYLRDKNGSADFNTWASHRIYKEKEIEKLVSPGAAHYDEVAVHYFVQWHLHRQLKAAADYLHARGLALKGDIPIGIYRHSCDAWVAPELYNMALQAGAPPDDFAVNGQNWGFPTYNWDRMKAGDFAWWRQRFQQMSLYFDAFRIDHILGFFRIWSIPLHAVEGILGYFVPALPVTEQELREAGIGFDYERLCKPYITDTILWERFGDDAVAVLDHFLDHLPNDHYQPGDGQYMFKPAFDTQQKVEGYFNPTPNPSPEGEGGLPHIHSLGLKLKQKQASLPFGGGDGGGVGTAELKKNLLSLLTNVILLDVTPAGAAERQYAFRFAMENTVSFKYLPAAVKEPLKALYIDYFFRRQDAFWQQEAMEKLPALKRSTNMLICGEDLGMVPACVPDVMQELGILSLEIQRMPKKTGAAFFHPKDAPYLSVVTPSTHDMSTIRGWWEEDRELIQRFFSEILRFEGTAPYFCEPWANRLIVEQHLQSPAMWAIFQLQDLMGMDGELRRQNPNDERINIPANPKHYWQYRMHLMLEDLQQSEGFNSTLRELVRDSRR